MHRGGFLSYRVGLGVLMDSVVVKNSSGQQVAVVDFGAEVAGSVVTNRLLRDAYLMYEACRRQGTVSVKTKGMIAGSKKKLFRQKGTGNARMGQKRTPLRRGGGNAFGKFSKDWGYRLPKKALRVATRMAFVSRLNDGGISVVDQFQVAEPKTKLVANLLKSFSIDGKSCLIVVGSYSRAMWLACRNIPGVTLTTSEWVNSYDILKNRVVLMTRDAFDACLSRISV